MSLLLLLLLLRKFNANELLVNGLGIGRDSSTYYLGKGKYPCHVSGKYTSAINRCLDCWNLTKLPFSTFEDLKSDVDTLLKKMTELPGLY